MSQEAVLPTSTEPPAANTPGGDQPRGFLQGYDIIKLKEPTTDPHSIDVVVVHLSEVRTTPEPGQKGEKSRSPQIDGANDSPPRFSVAALSKRSKAAGREGKDEKGVVKDTHVIQAAAPSTKDRVGAAAETALAPDTGRQDDKKPAIVEPQDPIQRALGVPVARIVRFELRLRGPKAAVKYTDLAIQLGSMVRQWMGTSEKERTTIFFCHGYGCVLLAKMLTEGLPEKSADTAVAQHWTHKLLQKTAAICFFDPPAEKVGIEYLKERTITNLGVERDDPMFNDIFPSLWKNLWKNLWDRIAAEDQHDMVTKVFLRVYTPSAPNTKDKMTSRVGGTDPRAKAESYKVRDQEKEVGATPVAPECMGNTGAAEPEAVPELKKLADEFFPGLPGHDFDLPSQFPTPQDPQLKLILVEFLPKAIMKQRIFSAINCGNVKELKVLLQVNRQLDLSKTKNRKGETLLKRAILIGSTDIMMELLSQRCVDVYGDQGLDAIKTVIKDSNQAENDDDKKERVDLLLTSGAGVRTGMNLVDWAKTENLFDDLKENNSSVLQLLEKPPPRTGPSAAILLRTNPNDGQRKASEETRLSVRQFDATEEGKPLSLHETQQRVARLLYGEHDSAKSTDEHTPPNGIG
ncbi:hypothetical protein CC80DRAFT_108076 [Byssothecium circinans]|uniref:Uncharacterized protein n=1 Tax=Byssothecium circinans TaxID=147558 RepID=A0A6A5UEN7_9PLEO|nr:hypothetical protein CC80DRAFT_108076 [Byssothecium circinans]